MDKSHIYSFSPVEIELKSLSSKDRKDQLLQYNLDKNLQFLRWRFTGGVPKTSSDYDQILTELLSTQSVLDLVSVSGSPAASMRVDSSPVKLTVTSMEFFDKLEESDIVGSGGHIKGCFDETFEGITVGDKLREMLLNDCSEQCDLYSVEEKSEFIFQLFKMVAVGGALCQPDSEISKYQDLAKDLYKDLVTIYRDSKTETVQFSGRVFQVTKAEGLELFPGNPSSSLNALFVIVDPMRKTVTIVKNSFKPFW